MPGDDNLIQDTFRITRAQKALIEELAERGIFGGKKNIVVRTLLDRAIKELIETEYVRKYLETRALLGNQDKKS